jgi:hypothetical protein
MTSRLPVDHLPAQAASLAPVESSDDRLIERLRVRAADPRRRTDTVPTRLGEQVAGLSFGELQLGVESAAADLQRLVSSIQSGLPIDDDLHDRAQRIEADMTTPVSRPLPEPATTSTLDDVEAQLGVPLPGFVRRLYLEVADGGFGPEAGLLPARQLLETYRELLASPPSEAEDDEWPPQLLPLVVADTGHYCVAADSGRIYESDYVEELDEEAGGEVMFRMVLRELSPTLQAWLTEWIDASATPG